MTRAALALALALGLIEGGGAAVRAPCGAAAAVRPRAHAARARPLQLAGFGKPAAGGGAAAKRGGAPLKAKKQWDRHTALVKKGAVLADVAARKDPDADWLLVGTVCAPDAAAARGAAARQRALIAEHAKRLHLPLQQLGKKAAVQVGYRPAAGAEFEPVKGEDGADIDADAIGFEGVSDPGSGFYCHYQDGRVVQAGSAGGKSGGKGPGAPAAE